MSVNAWFAQPDQPLGTAILLPGRNGGVATPLMHWPASLLTEAGWSVLGVAWDESLIERDGAAAEVRRCADMALDQAAPDQPVLIVAKSLGTLALPWAVEKRLPGVWLTPLLQDTAVVAAVAEARQTTLLVGGTDDPHWRPPSAAGPGVTLVELPDADHGLQQRGDWRRSLLRQLEIYDRVSQLAEELMGSPVKSSPTAPSLSYETCVVFMLGYPGMGKRTVGRHLASLLDGVLVDNALINRPLLELFRWDGVEPLPPEIWDRAVRIRDAVLDTIEDLAPPSNSYVFTNVIEEGPNAADEYERLGSVARRRGSLFLAVMLTCDIDEQVSRIDNADRVALRKGSDPEGYRGHRLTTTLYQPPPAEVIHLDTTDTPPATNAERIYQTLRDRGLTPGAD